MMKKFWLFGISIITALTIAFYSKHSPIPFAFQKTPDWKTFEKKSGQEIVGHKTTTSELSAARIPVIKRAIAQVPEIDQNSDSSNSTKDSNYLYRDNRVLIGDIQKKDYQNEQTELEMINKPNTNWKEILGNDLLRFQNEETKVLIKEEFPVIKIQFGKGQYLEQVMVSFLFKNGNMSSYRALVDSDTGSIVETWDKTINENRQASGDRKKLELTLPSENNSGIIGH